MKIFENASFSFTFHMDATSQNESNALRVDAMFFENGENSLRFLKYPDTCEQGLSLKLLNWAKFFVYELIWVCWQFPHPTSVGSRSIKSKLSQDNIYRVMVINIYQNKPLNFIPWSNSFVNIFVEATTRYHAPHLLYIAETIVKGTVCMCTVEEVNEVAVCIISIRISLILCTEFYWCLITVNRHN